VHKQALGFRKRRDKKEYNRDVLGSKLIYLFYKYKARKESTESKSNVF